MIKVLYQGDKNNKFDGAAGITQNPQTSGAGIRCWKHPARTAAKPGGYMALPSVNIPQAAGFYLNCAPPCAARRDLPPGFVEFLLPFHRRFTPRQQELIEKRYQVLSEAHACRRPRHLPVSPAPPASCSIWRIPPSMTGNTSAWAWKTSCRRCTAHSPISTKSVTRWPASS